MRLPRSLLVLTAIGASVALGACGVGDTGPQTSQSRTVASFTRVETHGAVDVRLRVGEPRSIQVRAGKEAIDDVRTEVHDGTLRISFERGGFHLGRTVVTVGVPSLDAIEADGAGDIAAGGLDGRTLRIHTNGAADVQANGKVDRLEADIDGAGDLKLADLEAREVHVHMSGAGDAEVRAKSRLEADVRGAGNLQYHGDPAVVRHVSGAAEIARAG